MSDVWDQLVDRALSSEPVVRPRVPTPYERTGPPALSAADEIEGQADGPTPSALVVPVQRPDGKPRGANDVGLAVPAPSPQPAPLAAAANGPPAIGPEANETDRRHRPLGAEVRRQPSAPGSPVKRDGTWSAAATDKHRAEGVRPAQQPAVPTMARSPQPVPRDSDGNMSHQDAPSVRLRIDAEPSPADSGGSTDAPIRPPLAVSPIVSPAVSPAMTPAVTPAESKRRSQEGRGEQIAPLGLDVRREMTASPPPAVHVTIGRLEIRAVPPARAEPKPVVAAPPARLSLDEYLKRRAEVSR